MNAATNKKRENYAADIAGAWVEARHRFVLVGRELIKAKAGLDHGEFEKMVEKDLPFDASVARRLMAIANDPRISKRAHAHVLPGAWTALYEITQLSDEQFENGIKDGAIHGGMTRQDVKRLKKPPYEPAANENDTCTVDDLVELAVSGKRFGLITADPPWKFETYSEKGEDRSPDYPTMPIEDICVMPVADLAADNCVLLLWVAGPLLQRSFEVIEAWGFAYKAQGFDWIKQSEKGGLHVGQGFWTRANMELCLLAKKGSPARLNADVDELIVAPRGRHSEKPKEFHRRCERLVAGPRLELFAREPVEGWTVWGDEIEKGQMEGRA